MIGRLLNCTASTKDIPLIHPNLLLLPSTPLQAWSWVVAELQLRFPKAANGCELIRSIELFKKMDIVLSGSALRSARIQKAAAEHPTVNCVAEEARRGHSGL